MGKGEAGAAALTGVANVLVRGIAVPELGRGDRDAAERPLLLRVPITIPVSPGC